MILPMFPNTLVITMRGRIGRELRADVVKRQLGLAGQLPFVDGVLLRMESPGGDAVESENIREAVVRLAERRKVVAYVNRVAASGGYLIASAAHEIVASKWALVGSIGVIVMRPNVTGLMERLGVGVVVRKTGPFKDLGSPFREPTDADAAKERELIDAIFKDFVATVVSARRLDAESSKKWATGEVFTGEHAREIGLVDAVGDEEAARKRLEALVGHPLRTIGLSVPTAGIVRFLRPAALLRGPATGRPHLEWVG